ncbi:FAD-dependent monooxygenase [Arthrobacter sp. zg-ZUI100]|uniref:FAD-dependent monooxygenase n=1 Tax=Arthrobacter jiangjiafuii TaxID=2817475 RepID=UPI001AEEB8A0|nr:FAD-dependent monooxygenase [Arthrobacter jiangjiafuii]MBP3037834.1 FAD-dependent monooxygenase [Arthrobacter jiangjiafuii]
MAAQQHSADSNYDVDVLIVGAGPTGLALAAQLASFGTSFRIIDRQLQRPAESRALALQPRTLEALRPFGISTELSGAGRPARALQLHLPEQTIPVDLSDTGIEDSEFPHLLFLSQARTEQALVSYLAGRGIRVERGVELQELERLDPEDPFAGVEAKVLRMDRGIDRVRARYVVGADGAHSTVRSKAGMDWRGSDYPGSYVLADLEADGVEPGVVHSYLNDDGFLLLFPLGSPAAWRMIGMKERGDQSAVTLESLQGIADRFTGGTVKLHDPQWTSSFKLSHQIAEYFQNGSVFLAGDAAHVHSPVAAQGMNTGIQDALNLGWKLALGARGLASEELVDSYDAERRPVGREVLAFTDRLFKLASSHSGLFKLPRTKLLPALAPKASGSKALRTRLFRAVSQLDIQYRKSGMVATGDSRLPAFLSAGPKAGDRLPDAVVREDGREIRLQELLATPGFQILLCGPGWPADTQLQLHNALGRLAPWLSVRRLNVGSRLAAPSTNEIQDVSGLAFDRLGLSVRRPELLLVRPDGYIGFRSEGTDLSGALDYLTRLTTPAAAEVASDADAAAQV